MAKRRLAELKVEFEKRSKTEMKQRHLNEVKKNISSEKGGFKHVCFGILLLKK